MTVLRAKTTNLFSYQGLTDKQLQNIDLNASEMKQGEVVLKSMPQRLVLELTNSCNLSCIMCGRQSKEFKKTFFDLKWLYKLTPILDRVTEVTLFGWGEPTVHPKFRDILEYLQQFPVKKYFLTNGMLLDRFTDLILETVDVMAVSLDGATPETNNRIRLGSDFHRIISNLKKLASKRRQDMPKRPHINFVMTIMRENLKEISRLVELARSIEIEEVKVVYLTAFSNDLADRTLYDCREVVQAAFDEAMRLAETNGILLKLPFLQGEDPAGDAPHKPCFVGWRDLFLGSDGYIRPCQSTSKKLFHFNDFSEFEMLWNSAEYQEFRKTVNQISLMPKQCGNCYQSSYANWNLRRTFLQNEIKSDFAPEWF